jgi:uncharacterized coiled-coil DUF342 family protein
VKIKNIKNLYLIILIAIILAIPFFIKTNPLSAASEPSRCKIAQQNLNGNVRDRDLRTRVDRLQAYQYMHKKLDIFVQRLENNDQLMSAELRQQVDDLGNQIDQFKNDYEAYDSARDGVTEIVKCDKDTVKFDRAMQKARQARDVLHQDIIEIDQTLNSPIKNSITSLYTQLLASSPSGASSE